MQAATEWYRKDCAAVETRASGRITPTLLDPVRVVLPDSNKELRLEEVATVGVREASTLLITVFEEAVSILLVKCVFSSIP
jgi:ribosome recycling factor